jgi:hypothetical protein
MDRCLSSSTHHGVGSKSIWYTRGTFYTTNPCLTDTAARSWLLVRKPELDSIQNDRLIDSSLLFLLIAWAELGQAMKDKLTIAEVNCEALPTLCKKKKITGYPTLML